MIECYWNDDWTSPKPLKIDRHRKLMNITKDYNWKSPKPLKIDHQQKWLTVTEMIEHHQNHWRLIINENEWMPLKWWLDITKTTEDWSPTTMTECHWNDDWTSPKPLKIDHQRKWLNVTKMIIEHHWRLVMNENDWMSLKWWLNITKTTEDWSSMTMIE